MGADSNNRSVDKICRVSCYYLTLIYVVLALYGVISKVELNHGQNAVLKSQASGNITWALYQITGCFKILCAVTKGVKESLIFT